nr:hypothetical protein Iba_chr02cCG6720 [Ipomoea batatas]
MGNPILFDWIFPLSPYQLKPGHHRNETKNGDPSVCSSEQPKGSLGIVIRKRRLTFGTRFGSRFRLPLICVVVVSCESSVNFIGFRQYAKLVTTSGSDIIVLSGVSGVVHSSRRLCFLRDQHPSPILGSSLCRRSGRRWFRVTSILSYWSCFAIEYNSSGKRSEWVITLYSADSIAELGSTSWLLQESRRHMNKNKKYREHGEIYLATKVDISRDIAAYLLAFTAMAGIQARRPEHWPGERKRQYVEPKQEPEIQALKVTPPEESPSSPQQAQKPETDLRRRQLQCT